MSTAPVLSREQIQAQKRRGTALGDANSAPLARQQHGGGGGTQPREQRRRSTEVLASEEGEVADGDAAMQPSLASVGHTTQRAYDRLPHLEARPPTSSLSVLTRLPGSTLGWRHHCVAGDAV